ncbi:radical SAM family heme chaperone HemW [Alkalimarinus alittae]|nr:radical SAM family heme chaperone HemW [Alkalimarinus alittae]
MLQLTELPPLSLYIHTPWCIRKCPYCDFNSHTSKQIPEAAYLKALLNDFDSELPYIQGRPLRSIFIGGGTPSLLSPTFYRSLLEYINAKIDWAEDIEITMEANPGTVEQKSFAGYREAGINRLSLGVQSFDDKKLEALGRIHGGTEAQTAINIARQSGFDNFNLDLMHGLPGQSEQQALLDLETALSFKPPHLSWYQLTIEPNTEFYSRPPTLPEDDDLWQIQEAGQALLKRHHLIQYEVSAYATKGHQAKHNLNYWRFGDYLGIGAGAHGKVTTLDPSGSTIMRYQKTRQPEAYLNRIDNYKASNQILAAEDLPLEFLMNVMRLNEGVSESLYTESTGLSLQSLEPALSQARLDKLIEPSRLKATEKGHLFLNQLLDRFL